MKTRLDRIQTLTADLARCHNDPVRQQGLCEKITRELEAAKATLEESDHR
jgi:hypothetical protein